LKHDLHVGYMAQALALALVLVLVLVLVLALGLALKHGLHIGAQKLAQKKLKS